MTEPDQHAAHDDTPWVSTFAQITTASLLDRFNIPLSHNELCKTLADPESPHHALLTLPSKNIWNGIVAKQSEDFQAYAQKLFIDYKLKVVKPELTEEEALIEGESSDLIDMKYNELVQLGEQFEEQRSAHKKLIAKSQTWLIQQTADGDFQITPERTQHIEAFSEEADDNLRAFQIFNQKFHDLNIEITTLLTSMSDYTIDPEQLSENKVSLEFDPFIPDDQDGKLQASTL